MKEARRIVPSMEVLQLSDVFGCSPAGQRPLRLRLGLTCGQYPNFRVGYFFNSNITGLYIYSNLFNHSGLYATRDRSEVRGN
jgi:hypothetical protein